MAAVLMKIPYRNPIYCVTRQPLIQSPHTHLVSAVEEGHVKGDARDDTRLSGTDQQPADEETGKVVLEC